MPMTITEKILASHSYAEAVIPGELIQVKVDLALANDITAPLAIDVFYELGTREVFDKNKIALVPDHFVPNKDIASAEQAKTMKLFARQHQITNYFEPENQGLNM